MRLSAQNARAPSFLVSYSTLAPVSGSVVFPAVCPVELELRLLEQFITTPPLQRRVRQFQGLHKHCKAGWQPCSSRRASPTSTLIGGRCN
jgi:hypothetical protein